MNTFTNNARLTLVLAAIVLLTLTGVSNLSGQERFVQIQGTATDPSGASVPKATVTVTNTESGRVYTAVTGNDGKYVIRDADPGRYKVEFQAQGFTKLEIDNAMAILGRELRIDGKLQVAGSQQEVVVTESAPLIDVGGSNVGANITSEEFSRLPKARSFQSLVALSPSVNTGQLENGFQVNGSSSAENQFTIDGISTNSIITGASRQNAVFEILQEVQVKTGGVDAEFGGAQGGVISAVTKSGGNILHGDLHYYFSGNSISAGPVQRLLLNPADDKTVSFVQDHKNPLKNHEVGYSLGGPLVKDKLFFYSAASPQFIRRENTYLSGGVTPVTIKQEQSLWQLFNKVSFQPWSRVRGSVFWLWSPTKSTGSLPAYDFQGNGITASIPALAPRPNIGFFSPQTNYGGNLDFTLSPTMLLSVRGGRFWDNYKDTGIPGVSPIQYLSPVLVSATLPQSLINNIPASQIGPTGFYNTPRLSRTNHDLGTRTYLQLDLSKLTHFVGTHDIKVGWGVQKNVNSVDLNYPGGAYVEVSWDKAFSSSVPGVPPAQRGVYGYYAVQDFRTQGTTGATMANLYIQDKWSPIRRLTLNVGVRFDTEAIPTFHREIRDNGFSFGWTDKIAPRLGAAYDLLGSGKVKLYGSWGRYTGVVPFSLSRGAFGADYWHVYYRALDTPDVFSLASLIPGVAASNGTNLPGKNLWSSVTGSSRDRRQLDFNTVADGIKPMETEQINAGAEFQVGPTMVFRAGFIRSHLMRTIEDLGVLVNGDEVYAYGNPGLGTSLINPSSGKTTPFAMPKAVRNYDALELSITRRFANRWLGSASYVYSQLNGNYPGLSNTDEVRTPTSGTSYGNAQNAAGTVVRNGDAASRAWDIDEILWDAKGHLDVQGSLATDRPHVVKLYGSYTFKWGTSIGANFYGGSGTPLSTYAWTTNGIPVFVNGRGDMGRTPALYQTDLQVAHEFRIREGKILRIEANVINLFNQKTARHRDVDYNRQRNSAEMNLAGIDLAKGYDYKGIIAATSEGKAGTALDPRYGLADLFNPGFAGRLGIKFTF